MNKLEIKEVLVNLKNWDWDVKDYRMTKKEAETCIKALESVLSAPRSIKKISHWCYGNNETPWVCPICGNPILNGAIGDDGKSMYHWKCLEGNQMLNEAGEYADNPTLQNGV